MNGFCPICTTTDNAAAALTKVERQGFLETALSEEWGAVMGRRAFMLEAHHTTNIERTRLTLVQVERLLGSCRQRTFHWRWK